MLLTYSPSDTGNISQDPFQTLHRSVTPDYPLTAVNMSSNNGVLGNKNLANV